MDQTHFTARRGLLRGLVSLPLIGGAVSLIGNPTAAAVPLDRDLLENYLTWLDQEKRFLNAEMAFHFDGHHRGVWMDCPAARFHGSAGLDWREARHASHRAALVLSAVGCDWRA